MCMVVLKVGTLTSTHVFVLIMALCLLDTISSVKHSRYSISTLLSICETGCHALGVCGGCMHVCVRFPCSCKSPAWHVDSVGKQQVWDTLMACADGFRTLPMRGLFLCLLIYSFSTAAETLGSVWLPCESTWVFSYPPLPFFPLAYPHRIWLCVCVCVFYDSNLINLKVTLYHWVSVRQQRVEERLQFDCHIWLLSHSSYLWWMG